MHACMAPSLTLRPSLHAASIFVHSQEKQGSRSPPLGAKTGAIPGVRGAEPPAKSTAHVPCISPLRVAEADCQIRASTLITHRATPARTPSTRAAERTARPIHMYLCIDFPPFDLHISCSPNRAASSDSFGNGVKSISNTLSVPATATGKNEPSDHTRSNEGHEASAHTGTYGNTTVLGCVFVTNQGVIR